MNEVLKYMHNRRSIRRYTNKPVTDQVLEDILKAGFRAPFAAQLGSVIYTRDPAIIKQLGKKIGVYPSTPVLLIFLIDMRRMEKIMAKREISYGQDDGVAFLMGTQDVSLVVENVIIAAESLGLGSVLYGAVPNIADELSELLKIPDRVFPLVGMSVGYPDPKENTELKPRYPFNFSAFQDSYRDLNDEEIQHCMNAMDYYETTGYQMRAPKIPADIKGMDESEFKVALKEGEIDTVPLDKYCWTIHISRKWHKRYPEDGPTIRDMLAKKGFRI